MFKKLAFKYLSDSRQELKNTVAAEIDASFTDASEQQVK
jgi:hypothetical protein